MGLWLLVLRKNQWSNKPAEDNYLSQGMQHNPLGNYQFSLQFQQRKTINEMTCRVLVIIWFDMTLVILRIFDQTIWTCMIECQICLFNTNTFYSDSFQKKE